MDAALFGMVFLWAAVASALAATILPSALRPRLTLKVAAAGASLAAATLTWALLSIDLSLEYVAETTSRATPWPYRVAALWGGMDGSMLFYAAMTAVVVYLAFRRRPPSSAMRVASGSIAALLGFAAVFANPFTEAAVPPVDGAGLLAILQHPAMIYHPPLLYLGLTTLVVPFALTAGPLLVGEGTADGDLTRRWLLVSWTVLTFGMAAGSNWAYVELGWGGFWAWDPVENTALMPWLAITAYVHTSRVTRRDGRLGRSTAILAMLPFAFSVLGVYLTRSGVTGSIHAFAEDPVIGRVLLGSAVVVAAAVVFLGLRAHAGPEWGRIHARRDSWLAGNTIVISAVLAFVLIGSAYPAYAQVFFAEDVAIDTTFYVLTVYPLALLVVAGAALGLRSNWGLSGPRGREWAGFAALAVVGAALVFVIAQGSWPAAPGVGLSAAAIIFLVAQLFRQRGRELVANVAHLGIALVVLGAAGSALGGEFSGTMRPGESIEVSGHTVTLESISTGEADRFAFARALFRLDGAIVLAPEIRGYEDQAVPVAEPALRSTPAGDVIVAISLLFPDANAVDVSVFVRPLVWWVWLGSLVIGAAGLAALLGRGAVAAAPRPGAREAQPAGGTASGRSAP